MNRFIEDLIIQWKNKKNRKPLILQGARQVGKTHILKQVGKAHFKAFHYFDLEERKREMKAVFNESSLDPKEILDKLSFISGRPMDLENDLIVLDEIQAVPRALTALKYFQEHSMPLFTAAAGSNLGIASSTEPFPVGKVECLEMYPMNFEEFLLGTGEDQAHAFIKDFHAGATSDIHHQRLFTLLKIYFITGGLPEAVLEYAKQKDDKMRAFTDVRKLQDQLLLHYEHDFSKYAGSANARHIERVFRAVPYQLSTMQDGNAAKFKFKDVISKGFRSYEALAAPIDWLVKAGLVFKVHSNDHPAVPLLAGITENKFKLFLFDVGLLGAINHLSPESIMLYDYGSYKGHFAENFVLQELCACGFRQMTTWNGRTSEIEFLTEIKGRIVPIEVKAGVNTKAKSLRAFMEKYHPPFGIKFTGSKFGYDDRLKIYNYPLYMISRFPALCGSF